MRDTAARRLFNIGNLTVPVRPGATRFVTQYFDAGWLRAAARLVWWRHDAPFLFWSIANGRAGRANLRDGD
jgi:hypothetical protein